MDFMEYREATGLDVGVLAAMNQRLIRDERHRNAMTVGELEGADAGVVGGGVSGGDF
jgi:hypothetical protein